MGVDLDNLGIAGEEGTYYKSRDLWRAMPISEMAFEPGAFYGVSERFVNAPTFATTVSQGGYYPVQDTSATIQGIPFAGGALRFATPATDNKEAHLQLGGAVGSSFKIDSTAYRDLAFEYCFRLNQVADAALYIGLGEEGFAGLDALVDDTGALQSKDFLGFHVPSNGSTTAVMSAVYRKAGQAMVTVQSNIATLTAGGVYRVGGYFEARTRKLQYYVNGVVGATLLQSAWSNFPDAQLLSPCRGIKSGEAVAKTFDLFWGETWAKR